MHRPRPDRAFARSGLIDGEIEVPVAALRMRVDILANIAEGNAMSRVPIHARLTTRQAADFLGVSRPNLVGLIERGELPHERVGTHRRVVFRDLMAYREVRLVQGNAALQALAEQAQKLNLGLLTRGVPLHSGGRCLRGNAAAAIQALRDSNRATQGLRNPLVETLAGCLSGHRGSRVYLRIDAQQELARVRFLRRATHFFRSLQVIVHRFGECAAQFRHRVAVKTDDVADAGDMADEASVLVAVLDACGVAAMRHGIHGLMPA